MNNIFNTYTFENHPVLQTIKLSVPNKQQNANINIDECVFDVKKNLTEDDLIEIFNMLCNNKTELSQVLELAGINFEFNANFVLCLLNQRNLSQHAMFYLLHELLCYCSRVKQNFDEKDFMLTLKMIKFITFDAYKDIALNMVSYILFSVAPYIDQIDVNALIDFLREIFYTKSSPTLSPSIVYCIFSLGKSGVIDSKTELLLQYISEVETTTKNAINEFEAASLFDRCFDELQTLSIKGITYLGCFAKKLQWCVACNFFNNIGAFTVKYLHQNDPSHMKRLTSLVSQEKSYDGSSFDDSFVVRNNDHENASCSTETNEKSVFRQKKLDFSSFPEAYKLPIVSAIISPSFRKSSPFADDAEIMNPVFNEKDISCLPKEFDNFEKIIFFVNKISEDIPKAKEAIINSFMSILKKEFDLDLAFAFVIMLANCKDDLDIDDIVSLFRIKLFDPRITIFNATKEYLPYFQLRFLLFQIIARSQAFDTMSFMDSFISYPLISAELFMYLNILCKNCSKIVLGEKSCNVLITFLPAYINSYTEGDTVLATSVRNVYTFYMEIMKKAEISLKYLTDAQFVSMFFFLLFDENIRKQCLESGVPLFMNSPRETRNNLATNCESLFIAFKNLESIKVLNLMMSIINSIVVIIQCDSELKVNIGKQKETICSMISSLKETDYDKDIKIKFIISVIRLLTVLSSDVCLNKSQRYEIANNIHDINGDEFNKELFDSMIGLITGSLEMVTPENYIKVPKYLILLYTVFDEKAIDFLQKMLEYAKYNRVQCHFGQLDLAILSKCEKMEHVMTEKTCKFFASIAEVASSPQVVFKFISIMNSEKGKTLSPYLLQFIDILTNIIKTKRNRPMCSIPLTNLSNSITLSNLDDIAHNNNVSLLLWVIYDKGSGSSNLLEITIDTVTLKMLMVRNELIISLNKTVQNVNIDMEPNIWTPILVTFANKKLQIRCNESCNEFTFPLLFKDFDEIKVGFNGIYSHNPALLGPFAFIEEVKTKEEYNKLKEMGPDVRSIPKCLYYVNFGKLNHFITLETSEEPSSVKAELKNEEILAVTSFYDVLISNFTVQVLIPLFAQVYVISDDDEAVTEIISKITQLFQVLFSVSKHSEEVFASENSWSIVGMHLSNLSKYLTCGIYQQLKKIYTQSTNIPFKVSLFNYVIMEPSVWIHTDSETIISVTKSWYDEMFPTEFDPIFMHFFEKFFGEFWSNTNTISNIESDELISSLEKNNGIQIIKNESFTKFDLDSIELVREYALLTLSKIAMQVFTYKDFLNIIIILFETKNKEAMLSILHLIRILVFSGCLSNFTNEQLMIIPKIFSLINTLKDDTISLSVIETFACIYDKGIFSAKSADFHVELLIDMISEEEHTPAFIVSLLKIVVNRKEWIRLCFAIFAYHTDLVDVWLEAVQHDVLPDKGYCINKAWCLWGLVAACECYDKGKIEQMNSLFSFILDCDTRFYEAYFMMVYDVATNDECVRYFLMNAANKILNSLQNRTQEQLKSFIDISVFFMFFRNKEQKSFFYAPILKQIEKDYKVSILEYKESVLKKPEPLSPKGRIEKAKDLKDFRFGIDFDPTTLKWKDYDLCVKCLSICGSIKDMEYSDVTAFIMAFSSVYDFPKGSRELLKEIKPSASLENYVNKFQNQKEDKSLAFEAIPSFLTTFKRKKDYYQFEMARLAAFVLKFNQETEKKRDKYHSIRLGKTIFTFGNIKVNIAAQNRRTLLAWKSLCSSLMAECSPWHKSVQKSIDRTKYKRDITICNKYCPMKMKINKKFDDHREASYARESGSQTIAQEMVEKYRKETNEESAIDDFLFSGNDIGSDTMISEAKNGSSIENDKEYENSRIYFEDEAELIKIDSIKKIKFLILKMSLIIDYEDSGERFSIEAKDISMILIRSFALRQKGIEVFAKDGTTYLIHFLSRSPTVAMEVLSHRMMFKNNCRLQLIPSYKEYAASCSETKEWIDGKLSNFEYLMFLNTISGRTFNDSSMYPVFPWVLKDYECDDVNDAEFRDLTKPIGYFGEARRKEIEIRLKDMEQFDQEAFMFSSCYSTPLSVFLFNMRMEPFTTLHIQMQSGKFDHAARQFSSITDAYRMTTSHINDYRELIPEFFFCDSFLKNENDFDLGTVGDKVISDVELPKWAHNDPLEFIYLHRKALEKVPNLEKWIDLIWGSKSRGEAAKEAFNLFDPNMYEDSWERLKNEIDDVNDPEYQTRKTIIEATMTNCGQIPPLLFDEDHPAKNPIKEPEIEERMVKTGIGKDIIASFVDFERESIIIITGSGTISYIAFDGQLEGKYEFNAKKITRGMGKCFTSIVCGKENGKKKSQNHRKFIFATTVGSLIIIDPESKSKKSIKCHSGSVTCLCSTDDLIVSGGIDTSTRVFSPEMRNIFSISSYSDEITCCAASSEFKTIVSCTHNGTVYIIDSRRNQIFKVLHIDNENEHYLAFPKDVLITKGWGFIIIYYTKRVNGAEKNFITMYTMKGEMRANFEIDFPVSVMATWETYQGFDYVLLGNKNTGRIYAFEAFFASKENIKIVANCKMPATSISISREKGEFVVVSSDGNVHFFNLSRIKT